MATEDAVQIHIPAGRDEENKVLVASIVQVLTIFLNKAVRSLTTKKGQ